jgi:hypothetical protein
LFSLRFISFFFFPYSPITTCYLCIKKYLHGSCHMAHAFCKCISLQNIDSDALVDALLRASIFFHITADAYDDTMVDDHPITLTTQRKHVHKKAAPRRVCLALSSISSKQACCKIHSANSNMWRCLEVVNDSCCQLLPVLPQLLPWRCSTKLWHWTCSTELLCVPFGTTNGAPVLKNKLQPPHAHLACDRSSRLD